MVVMIMVVIMVMVVVMIVVMIVMMIVVMVMMIVVMVVMMIVAMVMMMIVVMVAAVTVVLPVLQMTVQILHVVVMAIVRFIEYHIKVTAVNAGLFHSADRDPEASAGYPGEDAAQFIFVRTQIQERRDGHISADPRPAFQIQNFLFAHLDSLPPQARRLICVAI